MTEVNGVVDARYEEIYLHRIAEICATYEKRVADLTIENAHLRHAFEMSEKMRTQPPAETPLEEVDGDG